MNRLQLIKKFMLFIGASMLMSFIGVNSSHTPYLDSTFSVTIKFNNVRNKKGRIQVQIYKNQETFVNETPWKTHYVSKKNMTNGTITHTIPGLAPGTYGLALLDDENEDTKMDYSWLIPSEGFGFSDYYHTAWSKPKFNDFKFYLKTNKTVTMKVRYL